jgi:hypothetical protein
MFVVQQITESERKARHKTTEMQAEIESATQHIQQETIRIEQKASTLRREHVRSILAIPDFVFRHSTSCLLAVGAGTNKQARTSK